MQSLHILLPQIEAQRDLAILSVRWSLEENLCTPIGACTHTSRRIIARSMKRRAETDDEVADKNISFGNKRFPTYWSRDLVAIRVGLAQTVCLVPVDSASLSTAVLSHL